MTNIPHFDVKKSIIKKFFLAHQEKFGKYDLQNGFGKYYLSSIRNKINRWKTCQTLSNRSNAEPNHHLQCWRIPAQSIRKPLQSELSPNKTWILSPAISQLYLLLSLWINCALKLFHLNKCFVYAFITVSHSEKLRHVSALSNNIRWGNTCQQWLSRIHNNYTENI